MGIFRIEILISRQEYIFYKVYKKLGLSDKGILDHFTSPEFQVRYILESQTIALEPYG